MREPWYFAFYSFQMFCGLEYKLGKKLGFIEVFCSITFTQGTMHAVVRLQRCCTSHLAGFCFLLKDTAHYIGHPRKLLWLLSVGDEASCSSEDIGCYSDNEKCSIATESPVQSYPQITPKYTLFMISM